MDNSRGKFRYDVITIVAKTNWDTSKLQCFRDIFLIMAKTLIFGLLIPLSPHAMLRGLNGV